jgi:hypothetical protein
VDPDALRRARRDHDQLRIRGIAPPLLGAKALADLHARRYDPEDPNALETRHPAPPPHQQWMHGKKGAGRLGQLVEGLIAADLNAGGLLDLDDPVQRDVARGIRAFTDCSSTRLSDAGVAFHSHADLMDEISRAQQNPAADTVGALFARTVAASPANAPRLYRGMYEVDPATLPTEGETIDLGLSSFTSDPSVAENFSVPSFQQTPDRTERSVIFELAPGARALSVEKHAADYADQKEWVTTGRFRVTRRSTRMLGEELGYEAVVLEVEQIL